MLSSKNQNGWISKLFKILRIKLILMLTRNFSFTLVILRQGFWRFIIWKRCYQVISRDFIRMHYFDFNKYLNVFHFWPFTHLTFISGAKSTSLFQNGKFELHSIHSLHLKCVSKLEHKSILNFFSLVDEKRKKSQKLKTLCKYRYFFILKYSKILFQRILLS